MGNGLARFVASGCNLLGMPLPGIMGFCALLQRMGIFPLSAESSIRFQLLSLNLTLKIEM
jgi:hypothetical protein